MQAGFSGAMKSTKFLALRDPQNLKFRAGVNAAQVADFNVWSGREDLNLRPPTGLFSRMSRKLFHINVSQPLSREIDCAMDTSGHKTCLNMEPNWAAAARSSSPSM